MLCNDPKTFREDMLKGYVLANRNYVVEVPGGVARATETPKGKVAVINGGGSGHYPAFCGIIGSGFMDATVVGNVFTSPSADDVYHVAKAVESGSGVFIIGGNYAGDKMNFNLARDRLIAEGIDARSFYITDDVASGSKEEIEKRRGNVGTFIVFKIAGAASTEGYSFDQIVNVTDKANKNTRTMSIGLKGCTMPGALGPLFHVPVGKMEVGQGIHGEPGVFESDLVSASEIAELLVTKVLEEAPDNAGKKIGVILDGLGSTKYEELFVVWKSVAELLDKHGFVLVEPQVGEFVTSLDMAGIALSIIFLDEELEMFWKAPADTPAFKKGVVRTEIGIQRKVFMQDDSITYKEGSEDSKKAAKVIVESFRRMKNAIIEAEEELARIDSVAGDGDHGRGMVKGLTYAYEAAKEACDAGAGAGSVLCAAGNEWAAKAGGTSGVLWGEFLKAAGNVIGDDSEIYDTGLIADALSNGIKKIQELGNAKLGDKTMLDTLIPFAESFNKAARQKMNITDAWKCAAKVAQQAAEKTADMLPKVGRARPQAERSLGIPDAGAISMALCIMAVV